MPRNLRRRALAFLPLSPQVFHTLAALADRPRHGYGIAREVEERTAGATRLVAGTLYGILRRLTEDGLVTETGPPPGEEDDDPRRRYYRLSRLGLEVARCEAARLQDLVELARRNDLLSAPRDAGEGA
jgi:DNA-binding PadR family transcriptional regulator